MNQLQYFNIKKENPADPTWGSVKICTYPLVSENVVPSLILTIDNNLSLLVKC